MAADYETPVTLPPNAKIDLTIERSTSGQGGVMDGKTLTFRYRQEIAPAQMGYRVRQLLTEMALPKGLDPVAQTTIDQATAASREVTYDADESLAPVRIVDWEAYKAASLAPLAAMAASGSQEMLGALEAARKSFIGMTPEQGASFLREQNLLSIAQNAVLDLKERRSGESEVANPLGGSPIRTNIYLELESLDKSRRTAAIHFHQEFDPVSASQNMRQILLAMSARLPPGAPKPDEAELAGLKIENTLDCRSQMDTETGLSTRTECISITRGVDQGLQAKTRTDRWVISQRIAP